MISASTSVVRGTWVSLCGELGGAQIVGSRLAGPAVCNDVERYSLALVKGAHTGAFDRTDMNEDVLVTVLRLNEAKAFLVVNHFTVPVFIEFPFTDGVRMGPGTRCSRAHRPGLSILEKL